MCVHIPVDLRAETRCVTEPARASIIKSFGPSACYLGQMEALNEEN